MLYSKMMNAINKDNKIKIFFSNNWSDYEMLDTGEGEKLERFGKYTFVRPFEDAIWKKTLSAKDWNNADGKFWSSKQGAKSGWVFKTKINEKFPLEYDGIKFLASPTPFRHLGFFPEQAVHWDYIKKTIENSGRKIKFLNLFGYTGMASLSALKAGAEVTHIDASKQSLAWLKENVELSGMQNLPMRILPDDALKFIEREAKRGNKYDAIIMDPPKHGRGPKGEIWKLEEMLPQLLAGVRKILSDKPLFVILTSYSTDSSSLSLGYSLAETMLARTAEQGGKDLKGEVVSGEMCLQESSTGRLISLAHTAVWEGK